MSYMGHGGQSMQDSRAISEFNLLIMCLVPSRSLAKEPTDWVWHLVDPFLTVFHPPSRRRYLRMQVHDKDSQSRDYLQVGTRESVDFLKRTALDV